MHLLSIACKWAEKSLAWGLTCLTIRDASKGKASFLSIPDGCCRAIVFLHALPLFFSEGNLSFLIASQNPVGHDQDTVEASEGLQGFTCGQSGPWLQPLGI